MTKKYLGEANTVQHLAPDGWLRTHDLGSLRADGVLYYHGRVSEMLTIGGENVAAATIETVLYGHPAVAVAQAIGKKDSRLGEVAMAFKRVLA